MALCGLGATLAVYFLYLLSHLSSLFHPVASVRMCGHVRMRAPKAALVWRSLAVCHLSFVTVCLVDLEFEDIVRVAGQQGPRVPCFHLASTGAQK